MFVYVVVYVSMYALIPSHGPPTIPSCLIIYLQFQETQGAARSSRPQRISRL